MRINESVGNTENNIYISKLLNNNSNCNKIIQCQELHTFKNCGIEYTKCDNPTNALPWTITATPNHARIDYVKQSIVINNET